MPLKHPQPTPVTLTSAQRFCDELAARRVLKRYATGNAISQNLGLTHDEIVARYMVGCCIDLDASRVRFVDGSMARKTSGRWDVDYAL